MLREEKQFHIRKTTYLLWYVGPPFFVGVCDSQVTLVISIGDDGQLGTDHYVVACVGCFLSKQPFIKTIPELFWLHSLIPTMNSVLQRLSRVTNTWEDSDISVGERLVSLGAVWLRRDAATFIQDRLQEPLLCWYCADGTEHSFKHSSLISLGSRLAVRRLKTKHEFLVQRYFIVDGGGRSVCLLPTPVVMLNKTIWCHFQQMRETATSCRLQGHVSVLVEHAVFDGAVAHGHNVQLWSFYLCFDVFGEALLFRSDWIGLGYYLVEGLRGVVWFRFVGVSFPPQLRYRKVSIRHVQAR